MKFFHLSDLHIGRKLNERNLREVQYHVFSQIIAHAASASPDAIVIAGDVFDRSDPSPEAVALFDSFITDLAKTLPGVPVMIVSGNHDSGERIDMYRHILNKQNIYVAGRLPRSADEKLHKVTLEDEWGPVHFYLLPHVKPGDARAVLGDEKRTYEQAVEDLLAREEIDPNERSVLVSHQFILPKGRKPEEFDAERDARSEVRKVGNVDAISARVLKPFTYAALGHIHRPMDVADNARYCGTPLQYSISEAGQDKSITVVDLGQPGAQAKVSLLPLEPLHAVRRVEGLLDEVTKEHSLDYVQVILTDEEDLNPMDMRSRIKESFPNVLEYRHNQKKRQEKESSRSSAEIRRMDPLTLCVEFLGDTSEEDKAVLQKVIEKVKAGA